MIPDQMVCDLLLEALLLDEPGLQDDLGFVVDGFPRTATQVSLVSYIESLTILSLLLLGAFGTLCTHVAC
jgi:adenylate kinase family enzyme